ncbi:YidC/Oxa1 family membrane protein insertase [Candidatus Saccharibacteria bacterium]|nr:YidC/Oxa1 family membrane protein insertase [Candidatus Saccharibacteria bacterium]MCB9821111.1 YidC/Oxa1 family membrane protein insertase [Candidatus Nomurabacteria bacterium]
MFETILIKPVFNLLVAIYALIPGHNLGIAIIIFTVLMRILMWPLVKKQLHHAKAMRELQPEIKRIKKEAGSDRQKAAIATMALYKEREIRPLAGAGYILIQLPLLIALYRGVNRVANNPQAIIDNSYSVVLRLDHMQELKQDITKFDSTFVGTVDLTRRATEDNGIYWGAMTFVILSALVQYYSSKQLMVSGNEKKSLRKLLKDQSEGKDVDQSEINEAAGRFTLYIIPGMIFLVSLGLVAALPFYWFINGLIGYMQQRRILNQDQTELLATVDGKPAVAEVAQTENKKPNAKQKREAMKAGKITPSKTNNRR